jgi:hypothetical protein
MSEVNMNEKFLKVFLCHASEDKPKVRVLYTRLRQDGIAPWFDEVDLVGGIEWDIEIRKTVRKCDVILVCLTELSASKTGYGQKEIKFALDVADEKPEGTIYIIPLLFEKCEVPFRLEKWQWIRYFADDGYEKLIRALRVRAKEIGIEVIPGDGNIERARRPIEESSGRLLYKSSTVRELLKQSKDGVLLPSDIDILPSDVVIGITQEAMKESLEPFENDSRKIEEKHRILRLIGIVEPYQEWEEKNNKVCCFRNEASVTKPTIIKHIPVSSSNISSIGYSELESILEIAFLNRSVYRYFEIPKYLYEGLMNANSHGKFLNDHIKSSGYAYEKIQ